MRESFADEHPPTSRTKLLSSLKPPEGQLDDPILHREFRLRSCTDCARCFKLDAVAAAAPAKSRTIATSPSSSQNSRSSAIVRSAATLTQHDPATPFAMAYAALATRGSTE